MAEIPEREQGIHTDRELRASLERGMREAADGDVVYRGSFRRWAGFLAVWRTRHGCLDHKVYVAVRNDPGHCSTTYAKATGLPQHQVKKSLKRLVDDDRLRTEKHRHLERLPPVDIYHLGDT